MDEICQISRLFLMSIIGDRQKKMYDDINELYMQSNKSLEYCCNKIGICKQTYYNIKRRVDNANETTSSKSHVKRKKTHSSNLFTAGSSKKTSTLEDDITGKEIECVPSDARQVKKRHKKPVDVIGGKIAKLKTKEGIDNDAVAELADEFIKNSN